MHFPSKMQSSTRDAQDEPDGISDHPKMHRLKQYRRAETVLISHQHAEQDKVLLELLRSSAF